MKTVYGCFGGNAYALLGDLSFGWAPALWWYGNVQP